ncbi:hypothetical protein [Aurantimonas manganoxydans]|uniref:hypothetical protein n=1 Tax=Aurantimonas manganoxydans TaxID=651183 RepID=UPI0002E0D686|nr:hypothetical protein [Aurantimonas manganoxydans]
MTLERKLSLVAYAILCAFLLILITHVPTPDLGLVLLATVLLAGYDLFFHDPTPRP